ncbi:Alpha/Beta hydrolase protein [Aspergillus minisclerotigenes]|uniref:Alpha/Beta hydrolase protein n=1 Tax=Aspergillus minisclerotigenes TaxID=656917 RepID=A0A5N6JC23_9EURO|nr:Alpha/Beta hydrolase protein [Aspergillus minisclerotigenes]
MPRKDISFTASDNVTLRGWLYRPQDAGDSKLPCLVMAHGFWALKEMDLDAFAAHFVSKLPLSFLVYDNRGFGDNAITYAQSRPDVDSQKIGVWGNFYSGGHVLWLGAVDKRVKVVLSQVPCVDGWSTFHRLIRPDFMAGLNQLFEDDRLARVAGKPPGMLPVVNADVHGPSALPTPDSYEFFTNWAKKSNWKNEVTVKSVEAFREYNPSAHIHHISPAPLLMTIAQNDVLTPTDIALEAFSRALEPKQLHILPGGHFDGYSGPNFEANAGCQTEFLRKHLCSSEMAGYIIY